MVQILLAVFVGKAVSGTPRAPATFFEHNLFTHCIYIFIMHMFGQSKGFGST